MFLLEDYKFKNVFTEQILDCINNIKSKGCSCCNRGFSHMYDERSSKQNSTVTTSVLEGLLRSQITEMNF